jgi:hypothetical protein
MKERLYPVGVLLIRKRLKEDIEVAKRIMKIMG